MRFKLCRHCEDAETISTGSQIFYLCPIDGGYRSITDECKIQREFFKRVEEEGKLPPLMVVEEEVEWAKEKTDSHKGFWCPHGRNPLRCGEVVPCNNEVYDKCIEFLKANMFLYKVEKGEIKVQWRTMRL